MRIIRNVNEITARYSGACVTIGNFDGVHKGHQQLFARVVEKAGKAGGAGVAITFDPHPLQVLRPKGIKLISNWTQKEELIEMAGIDLLLALPFTREFADMDAEDFVREILVKRLAVERLVVGYDYAFGKGRKGNIDFLRKQGAHYGFPVEVVPPFQLCGEVVSSSRVRELVESGNIALAGKLLGRPYQIRGTVKYGKQRGGRELGFPTANLHFNKDDLIPKCGVYVTRISHKGKMYGGVLNIGFNPTFEESELVAETHIFDFNEDIYGQEIVVSLLEYVRGEVKCGSVEELISRIGSDVAYAKRVLAKL